VKKRLLSVVTACYNEEGNVEALAEAVKKVFAGMKAYDYEHIFIDNSSKDGTVAALRRIAAKDKRVKFIVNARNFGHIRSPFHALLQAKGEAVISVVADFQDPPELIPVLVAKWEEGYKIVAAVKSQSEESPLFFALRRLYYWIVTSLAEVQLIKNFTGFGLYDKRVIEILRELDDPYPYFRGLISDIGFEPALVPYLQPQRRRGITKNNFGTLYDLAMLGITTHSKVPLRLAAMLGFVMSAGCFVVAAGYLAYKLVFWQQFSVGIAPLVIGFFLTASVQLLFIGIIGEYLGNIHTQVLKRPRVVEKERVNF
jgi:glycosyltransferase involved in cell wall biosynthesis